jgi:hypothetical protein
LWAWTTVYFYFLSHFHPLKTCYIITKVSAEQNASHVQLYHYFIWQVMTCVTMVACPCVVALKLIIEQRKPCCTHFLGCRTLVSPFKTCKIAPSFLHRNHDNSTCSFGLKKVKKLYYNNNLPCYCLTAGLYNAIHTMQVLDTSAHMKQDIV